MARRRDTNKKNASSESTSVSRRNFIKQGLVASVGAAALGGCASNTAAQATSPDGIKWDYEADLVVIGAGCSRLPCAIRARDAGLNVLVIDQNFDVGGKMLHSGGQVSLGGGDPCQLRDIAGQGDKEGFIKIPPLHKPEDMTEDTDFLFGTSPTGPCSMSARMPLSLQRSGTASRLGRQLSGHPAIPHGQLRALHATGHPGAGFPARGARPPSSCSATRRTSRREPSRARTRESRARARGHFAPLHGQRRQVGRARRGLERRRSHARSGVQRAGEGRPVHAQPENDGDHPRAAVLGTGPGGRGELFAEVRPLHQGAAGKLLAERQRRRTARDHPHPSKEAVFVGSGGHGANPQFRSMFYPAFNEPAFVSSAWALLGPHGQDASGIIAGMRIGATLAGMQQNLGTTQSFHIPAAGDARLLHRHAARSPDFQFRKSTGITLGTSSYEHLIAVNQVGKRFYNEMDIAKRYGTPVWPGGPRVGAPKPSLQHVQCDWRNCGPDWVRQMYNGYPAMDAAMAMNEGSQPPLLLGTAVGDLRPRHGRARQVGHQASLHRRQRLFLQRRHHRTAGAEDPEGPRVPAGAAKTSRRRCASGTRTWTQAPTPTSGAARMRRCTRSTSRLFTPPRSARSGTTPMEA